MDAALKDLKKMIPQLGVYKLRDLIKAIRSCKTAAEERAVIAKESAFIRTSFKEENVDLRAINVAKLLYIHMLGYPAHFGQIECLKLVASPLFSDKRLGYLGTMMLLDENQEVLTLVTNCLKNDMNNSNQFIISLALSTLGNISSKAMARDLSNEVERLLSSSNTYVRKKAALCAMRLIKKVPDLIENFLVRAKQLIHEKSHAPLLTGITLLIEMCHLDSTVIAELITTVPTLVKNLKSLVSPGYSPEHDVSGISDPFLQVKILRLLRIIGKGNPTASEAMNDVLAQVATTTEGSKNVGNSILYECVLTIMEIESSHSLRVLGVNILGKFLSNKDNNIKYVALTTLTKTAQSTLAADSSTLQRHRAIIIECLHDPDISIKRRALDLCFHLMNGSNARVLTRELLTFLEECDGETKTSVSSRICEYAGRYRPNARWELDTVIRVLRVAGGWVDQSVVNYLVKLVSNCNQELQQYAVKKLYQVSFSDGEKGLSQQALVLALFWHIGEYGDLLVIPNAGAVASDEDSVDEFQLPTPSEQDVVDHVSSIMRGSYGGLYVKEYGITALAKLSARFTNGFLISQIKELINQYVADIQIELQQRAVEYGQIFGFDTETRIGLLEKMPILESSVVEEAKKGAGTAVSELSPLRKDTTKNIDDDTVSEAPTAAKGIDLLGTSAVATSSPLKNAYNADLYSLVFGGNETSIMDQANDGLNNLSIDGNNNPDKSADLLGDLLNSLPASSTPIIPVMPTIPATPATPATPAAPAIPAGIPLQAKTPSVIPPKPSSIPLDILNNLNASKSHVIYEKHGLRIELSPTKDSSTLTLVEAKFDSINDATINDIVLQVAVPKSLKLTMFAPDSSTARPGKGAKQSMKIENPSQGALSRHMLSSFNDHTMNISSVEIKADNVSARFINYGATLTHFMIDGIDVVLGFDDPKEYVSVASNSNPYFGCIVGRVANRIKNGVIELNSSRTQLECNNGPNALHGGVVGFDKNIWQVKEHGADYVIFYFQSKSGDQGYPGEIDVTVTYSISGCGLQIDYNVEMADSEANANLNETVVNLSNHSYFNLSNEDTIKNHFCEMNTMGHLELDANQIPTGTLVTTNHDPAMDFTLGKSFGEGLPVVTQFRGYDHFFLKRHVAKFDMAVKITCNNVGLELWTDAPGFQLYTGNWLDGSCRAKDGKKSYGQYSGFCLEASYPPDSLNLSEWRDKVILKKGNIWKRRDLYRISKCN